MNKKTYYKGDKYIYFLMAVKFCILAGFKKDNKDFSNSVSVGDDDGMVGGQNYYRRFQLQKHDGKWLLNETKNSRHFAEFTRTFEIDDIERKKPLISDYINEYGENGGKSWIH